MVVIVKRRERSLLRCREDIGHSCARDGVCKYCGLVIGDGSLNGFLALDEVCEKSPNYRAAQVEDTLVELQGDSDIRPIVYDPMIGVDWSEV